MTYAALLDRHVFGGALQAAAERDLTTRYALATPEALTGAIAAARDLVVADGRYPVLSSWMASPTVTTPREQLELSLTFLLDGDRRPPAALSADHEPERRPHALDAARVHRRALLRANAVRGGTRIASPAPTRWLRPPHRSWPRR